MLRFLTLPASLCAFILATTAASRSIIPPPQRESIPEKNHLYESLLDNNQQLLSAPHDADFGLPTHRTSMPPPRHVNTMEHFDARENSVGVLFIRPADEETEVLHLWLPLGKRVYTRDSPVLPLHPETARLTTLITTTPSLASPEQLDRIECDVWLSTSNETPVQRKVSFSRRDELVRFAQDQDDKFWLGGGEVESYECHS
ncbi:hypothetical protein Slin15195_G125630 [Septoria linicola]|uniref:Uncharacterized protein n=1 Tax=Septoria linicola TaxID=215465 RepID=A0A9Q9B1I8_9PEZI|nr:hypothetical protein Slin14017_G081810 [Septoria linicola]USW59244.1 hypothetical protein Slin15195_G125630 [Septoria linicola]